MSASAISVDELAERRLAERQPAASAECVKESKLGLRRDGGGRPIPDEENVLLILAGDDELCGAVSYDEFTDELLLTQPIPGVKKSGELPRRWRDEDTVGLQAFIQRRYLPRLARDKVAGPLRAFARSNCAVHPLREYLNGLVWDRQPRLHRFLADYFGADETLLNAEFGTRWAISAVARVYRPGCQADCALVLEGAQGIGKTSALRALCHSEDYFSDSLPHDLASKDARAHTVGKWIIEMSELTQFKKSEIETVKGFLSRREEKFRPAYGRNEIIIPRQCVFAGTTNEAEYLVDSTGNRRFWCVAVTNVDVRAIARDRDQVWAEAVHRYKAGERWHLSPELERCAADEATKRQTFDPLLIAVHGALKSGGRLGCKQEVTPSDVLGELDTEVVPARERNQAMGKRIGAILQQLGWTRERRIARGQLFRRPKIEIALS